MPALSQTELFQSFNVKSCCLDSLSGKDNDNASKQCATMLRTVEFQGRHSFTGGLSFSTSILRDRNAAKRVNDGYKTLDTDDYILDIRDRYPCTLGNPEVT